ncbi:MAG TPA: ATP-binding cassette domain-containing protein [Thermodesulfobacteriota bacterium]|nr:ATP-binding cassette domain-containing protein [Thermodesulfobacteriota bacterium]
MDESKALMEIENLVVFYENAIAVNNVSLQCQKGKITAIFGSNSAGKSTLMWTVSGIIVDMKKKEEMKGGERITWFGDIRFAGEDISGLKPNERAKRRMILCPERRLIFTESTVLENLKIGGYLASHDQAKRTLEYVFNLFPELKELKGRPGGFLSGGEQQMLAIGRALMAQPKLLLLDEPLLGLAPAVEIRLARAVKEINSHLSIAVLVAEQYARPIIPIVDYCYVLENGGNIFSGTPEEFKNSIDVMNAYFGGLYSEDEV